MKIVLVVGARPNFMKVAPIIRAINKHNASAEAERIVDTVSKNSPKRYEKGATQC